MEDGRIDLNLLDNGIRYTDNGVITVRLHQQHKRIMMTIEDSGSGTIDCRKISRITRWVD
ncbi:sensor histidine kinase [Paenibacillus antarcticus]|uniref:ATP-binding protein n=1 Tax=Paenibacillus antarcticus TaxID=253703 RepID=UPI0011F40048